MEPRKGADQSTAMAWVERKGRERKLKPTKNGPIPGSFFFGGAWVSVGTLVRFGYLAAAVFFEGLRLLVAVPPVPVPK